MIIQDVITAARYSELSSVAVKDNDAAVISFLNLGMLELHKRFPIKVNEQVIPLVTGVFLYSLRNDYMYALSAHGKVAAAPDTTVELGINEADSPTSVFFPSYKQVQIPAGIVGTAASVVYVAKPYNYTVANLNDELDLPETLIEPLLHYIGYKGHLGVRGDAQAENNTHYQRFDRSCKKAKELGVAFPADSWNMTTRLNERGFA